jgi:BirA family biotin operon repressor/biotin-[acetyl-CoA-carboxylase] ligase
MTARGARPLAADQVFGAHGGAAGIGAEGEVLPSAASTMDVARERALSGAPDGYVVLAEHQTAGRGRKGAWHCPPGRGLLVSVILKLGLPRAEEKLVAIMGAVAGAEAVRRFGVPGQIKWPNDVVVGAAEDGPLRVRKLGGVLVERVPRGDAAPAHILGIGLNVNQSPDELPRRRAVEPTSMHIESGRDFDRNAVCRALLAELNSWYRRLAMGQQEHVLARWRRRSCLLDRDVRARVGGRVLKGKVTGVRSTGELILRDAAGRRVVLSEGKARLLL